MPNPTANDPLVVTPQWDRHFASRCQSSQTTSLLTRSRRVAGLGHGRKVEVLSCGGLRHLNR
jgi:hypothetical protein